MVAVGRDWRHQRHVEVRKLRHVLRLGPIRPRANAGAGDNAHELPSFSYSLSLTQPSIWLIAPWKRPDLLIPPLFRIELRERESALYRYLYRLYVRLCMSVSQRLRFRISTLLTPISLSVDILAHRVFSPSGHLS